MRIRILIDTNIFVYREANRKISPEIASLYKLVGENELTLLVHPKSIDEIERYPIEERKKIALSKINSYPQLTSPPDYRGDQIFLQKIDDTNKKNEVDNQLLYAVYRKAINFLVTEDKGILKKAKKLDIKENVLTVSELTSKLKDIYYVPDITHPPSLKLLPVYNLDKSDPFFDSLRSDYITFDKWLDGISKQGRNAYVYIKESKLAAIGIFKDEDEPVDSIPPLPKRKRLKISTFRDRNSTKAIISWF